MRLHAFSWRSDTISGCGYLCLPPLFFQIYAGQRDIVNNNYNDAERLRDIRRQRPSRPSDHGIQMSDDVWQLIHSCWHPDPSCRPTMDNILDQMKEIGFGTL